MAAHKPTHIRRALTALAPFIAAGALLAAPADAAAASCKGADANPAETNLKSIKRATVCLLNKERRSHGLKKLKVNNKLSLASQRHTNDMARRNYFAHGNFVGRIKSARYMQGAGAWTVGENIAWGAGDLSTPAEIVDAWMHSPGHRHNILNSKFKEIGIGVTRGVPVKADYDGATYGTAFGRRG